MMPVPTTVARGIETHPVLIAMRTALIANTTIATMLAVPATSPTQYRIYPGADLGGGAFPFIDYLTVSDVTEGSFSHAGFNDLIQFTAHDKSSSTANVVTLATAILDALMNTPWSISGWALIGKGREGARLLPPELVNGIAFQNYPVTIRVEAIKT
jgi:cellulase/cellobiase CelA1